ncbi:MAG: methylated-DNA--[protein]-cysteine S-methyltransferase [Halobacteriales archaeon]|nr:methylated-DNA--[protein]-cysteine S-methyltransferase [Halobacteriales archaeon]
MDADGAGIEHRWSGYLDTYVQVGVAGGRVVSVTFTDEPTPESEEVEKDGTDALEAVFEYLDAETRATPDVPYALTVSGVERSALERTRDIPYGTTLTYDEFADSLGEDDVERVRDALHANPVPIVLPSHRVVAEDGVGGFAGPRRVKRLLLKLED